MLLDRINSPADLRTLSIDELRVLAVEVRQFVVEAVSRQGGHLGSNLGAVELTFAVHRVFDSPRDTVLWDTGHQAYVHKLVTGRRDAFGQLRQESGLSGYPSRAESEHDHVENSHASTILSYAHGLATARDAKARPEVPIVGPLAWSGLQGVKAAFREVLSPKTFFEALGVRYTGPFDGHDVPGMEHALRHAAAFDGPIVVHVLTKKGLGYPPAETDVEKCLHDVSAFDPATGAKKKGDGRPTYTQVFSDTMLALADGDPDVVAITAAMPGSTGLLPMQQRHPGRVIDVGIAEQHAVTAAAGMAMGGLKPVVAIYSTFFARAFDQAHYDVGLHGEHVVLAFDRAGITGDDGASHHGVLDLSLCLKVPGMTVFAPSSAQELERMLADAVALDGPASVRFPKGVARQVSPAEVGSGLKARRARRGRDVCILAVGRMFETAEEAAEQLSAASSAVSNMRPTA